MEDIKGTLAPHAEGGAIIVGIQLQGEDAARIEDGLEELQSLLSTLRVPVRGKIIQRRQKLTPSCLLGTGKVMEIKEMAERAGAPLIVVDRSLSPPQVRNLEQMTGKEVLDRTGVILEIFSRHARTTQAKTQVEIARLEYLLPRLAGAWTHFQRQAGGGHLSRGMGEKQIEIDRRRARERINKLKMQLEQIRKEKQIQRKARSNELKVALVGYTNSGKTSVMKGLTKATIEGKDELFATLDTNIKTIDPRTRPKILLSDTVGFIRDLPHSLVESFKSTLDEVSEADLLLHVVDVSHSHYRDQVMTTQKVLEEIGAAAIPTLMVFNKADQLDDKYLGKILKSAYPGSVIVLALNFDDMVRLRDTVYDFFKKNMQRFSVSIPVTDQAAQSVVYKSCLILNKEYTDEDHMVFEVQATMAVKNKLKLYVIGEAVDVPSSQEVS